MTKPVVTKDAATKLADGWRWVRLGDIANTTSGTTPSRSISQYYGGDIPWIKTGELRDGYIEQAEEYVTRLALDECSLPLLPPETLLIAMYGQGQTRGRTGILRTRATINQACFAILPNETEYSTQYLQAWFRLNYQRIRTETDSRGGNQPNLNGQILQNMLVPLPPVTEQQRIVAELREQMAAVERARAAAHTRLDAALSLPAAFTRQTLVDSPTRRFSLRECLIEVRNGVGADWSKYPVLGATRDGLAPAKEGVGKAPERYKLVDPVTVFYNPMRILLGSIAMVDEVDVAGITSPDYVVVKGRPGILDTRWFYYWFRSAHGAHLIDSLSRGAVRERILFNRLAVGEIELPDFDAQRLASERMKRVRPVVETIINELETINALPSAIFREAFAGAA